MYCLLFLIQQIPLIGPAVICLVNKVDTLILAEPKLQLRITAHTPALLANNIITRKLAFPIVSWFAEPPVTERGLVALTTPLDTLVFEAMNQTQKLADISMSLLPITRLLQYSSYSLLGASVVVRDSNMRSKAKLSQAYDGIQGETEALK